MLLVPRRSLGLALVSYSFVEDTFTQERSVRGGYLLFFLYFSFSYILVQYTEILIFTTESIFFQQVMSPEP